MSCAAKVQSCYGCTEARSPAVRTFHVCIDVYGAVPRNTLFAKVWKYGTISMHAHAGRYFVARPYCNLVRFAPFFFVTQPGSAIYYWKILVRNPVNLYRLVKVLPICSKAVRRLTGGYWCASWSKYIFFCSCYTKPGAVERHMKTGNFDAPRTRI